MNTPTLTAPSCAADLCFSDELSVAAEPDGNYGKACDTPFAGERELKVLARWLEQEQSDADGWHILNELTRRSLDRINMSESARCFTTEELCDWAGIAATSNLWKSVKTWWESRRRRVRLAMCRAGVDFEPILDRRGGGGRGNRAVNSLRMVPLIEGGAEESLQETNNPDVDTATGALVVPIVEEVLYWQPNDLPVKLSNLLLRRLFSAGEMGIGSLRHNLLRFNLLGSSLFMLIFSISAVGMMVIENRPIGTRDLGLLFLVGIGGLMWWQQWRPVLLAREDRITPLPDEWLPIKAAPAQLERKRTDSGEVLRLVRYVATCPVCGGDMHLARGAPEWPRRTVGRCADAPREHVFSFDPVKLVGHRL
ncbi:hypothetical protein [Parazoarcus communis]|uniref:hypothetical protein n=1 Tax=Parazoarcus communis TaxID=41977 RepID=UPI001F446540|nr:hypothetical protein [Parazoarcus communis]